MPTRRLTTMEVQVDDFIYTFNSPDSADAFEACAATVDVAYCETTLNPVSKRAAEPFGRTRSQEDMAAKEERV